MSRPNPPEVPPGVGDSDPHAEQEPRLRPGLLFRWGAFASLGVLATLAAAAAVYTARAVLIRAAIALFVAISLDPAVRWLVRKGVRRSVAVTIIFAIVLALTAAFLMSVIPAMVSQFRGLVDDLPRYLNQLQDRSSRYRELSDRYNLTKQIQSVISSLPSRLGSGLFGLTGRIFGALFSTLTVLVLAIYFMADLPRLRNGVVRLFPRARRSQMGRVADVVIDKVGAYMIGNILISLVAGLAAFVCLTALKVPFSVPLAFVVALTDLIPMIGATLGAIIVVLLTLFTKGLWPAAVLVAIFFLIYQQLENYFIAPRILKSSVNLSAAAVLLAGLIGATALGLVGALMAIPVAAAVRVLLTEQLQARDAAEAKSEAGPAVTGMAAFDKSIPSQAETTADDGAPAERRPREAPAWAGPAGTVTRQPPDGPGSVAGAGTGEAPARGGSGEAREDAAAGPADGDRTAEDAAAREAEDREELRPSEADDDESGASVTAPGTAADDRRAPG
jgi:predicted PurR-regulated permease PerM